LKRFKKYFKGCGANVFGNMKVGKKDLLLRMENMEKCEEDDDLPSEQIFKILIFDAGFWSYMPYI
jgi:hypothetical protein